MIGALRVAGVGLLLTACGSDPDSPPGDAAAYRDEPSELQGITQLHNDVRAAVGVAPLVWDPHLAAIAAAWVAKCVDDEPPTGLVDHNKNRSQGYPTYVGENVYGSAGAATARGAVTSWASEQADYNYTNNTCGDVCGHYTQIVWRATTMVGCAKNTCNGFRYPVTIVCNYGPGGNIGGERPY